MTMFKVLLAKCPRLLPTHFPDNTESLALGYLAACLREASFDVDILDASLLDLSLEATIQSILSGNYALVGFTISDPTFLESTLKVAGLIKKHKQEIHITIGGHTPTFHAEEIISARKEIDSIIMYEGEGAILDLATALFKKEPWANISNLVSKIDGRVIMNPPRPLIKDLDSLPFPSRDLLPHLLENRPDIGVVSVSSSRGCFRNCAFCSIRAFYKTPPGPLWRSRGVSDILKEIEELHAKFEIKEIAFVDDIFFGTGENGRRRRLQLADELIKRRLGISLALAVSVKEVDEKIFSRLYDAGLRQVLLGLESASQRILDYLGKGTTPDDGVRAVNVLTKLGIDPVVSFINFTPETTIEDLRHNLDYFSGLKVIFLQGLLNRLQVYKGTDIESRLRKEGILRGDSLNPYYKIKDERVEMVYHISTKSLGKLLSIAYEIKRVERAFRLQIFLRDFEGLDCKRLLDRKKKFNDCVELILEECSKIFLHIIDHVEAADFNHVDSFINEMKGRLKISYDEWMQIINLFSEDMI